MAPSALVEDSDMMYMMQALIRAALNYEMEHYLWFPEMYREELHHEDLV